MRLSEETGFRFLGLERISKDVRLKYLEHKK